MYSCYFDILIFSNFLILHVSFLHLLLFFKHPLFHKIQKRRNIDKKKSSVSHAQVHHPSSVGSKLNMPAKFRILGLASLLGLSTLFLGKIKLSKVRSVFGVDDDASLREAAGGTGIFIGAAINYNYVSLDSSHHDDTYASVAAREFNQAAPSPG